MEAKEIRIDNYVSCDFGIVRVSEINLCQCTVHSDDFKTNTAVFTDKLKGIPLTEEILIKSVTMSDIKYIKFTMELYADRFKLRFLPSYKYWYVMDRQTKTYITKVEFVHEWQNVFHALNGQELKISL